MTKNSPAALADIDRRLRAEIRERQQHRDHISRVSAGDSLALRTEAFAYLARMHELGFPPTSNQHRTRQLDPHRRTNAVRSTCPRAQIEHEPLRQLYLESPTSPNAHPTTRLPILADRVEAFLHAAAAEATGPTTTGP